MDKKVLFEQIDILMSAKPRRTVVITMPFDWRDRMLTLIEQERKKAVDEYLESVTKPEPVKEPKKKISA